MITLRGLDLNHLAESVLHDQLRIDALGGHDRLIAGLLPNSAEIKANQVLAARAVDNLTLIGGSGDDWIVGSPYADTIDSGEGDDTVIGNGGVDSFSDAGGTDTLMEARISTSVFRTRNWRFPASNNPPPIPPLGNLIVEREGSVIVFEHFKLFGGATTTTLPSVTSQNRPGWTAPGAATPICLL